MASLLEMFNVFEDQTAKQRVKAAMRIVASEVRAVQLPVDATTEETTNWTQRRKVVERWQESPAHWTGCVIDTIADLPEIIALGVDLAKPDSDLGLGRDAVDNAILTAVRGAVDAWKTRV